MTTLTDGMRMWDWIDTKLGVAIIEAKQPGHPKLQPHETHGHIETLAHGTSHPDWHKAVHAVHNSPTFKKMWTGVAGSRAKRAQGRSGGGDVDHHKDSQADSLISPYKTRRAQAQAHDSTHTDADEKKKPLPPLQSAALAFKTKSESGKQAHKDHAGRHNPGNAKIHSHFGKFLSQQLNTGHNDRLKQAKRDTSRVGGMHPAGADSKSLDPSQGQGGRRAEMSRGAQAADTKRRGDLAQRKMQQTAARTAKATGGNLGAVAKAVGQKHGPFFGSGRTGEKPGEGGSKPSPSETHKLLAKGQIGTRGPSIGGGARPKTPSGPERKAMGRERKQALATVTGKSSMRSALDAAFPKDHPSRSTRQAHKRARVVVKQTLRSMKAHKKGETGGEGFIAHAGRRLASRGIIKGKGQPQHHAQVRNTLARFGRSVPTDHPFHQAAKQAMEGTILTDLRDGKITVQECVGSLMGIEPSHLSEGNAKAILDVIVEHIRNEIGSTTKTSLWGRAFPEN